MEHGAWGTGEPNCRSARATRWTRPPVSGKVLDQCIFHSLAYDPALDEADE